jgi:hypothetical protein
MAHGRARLGPDHVHEVSPRPEPYHGGFGVACTAVEGLWRSLAAEVGPPVFASRSCGRVASDRARRDDRSVRERHLRLLDRHLKSAPSLRFGLPAEADELGEALDAAYVVALVPICRIGPRASDDAISGPAVDR